MSAATGTCQGTTPPLTRLPGVGKKTAERLIIEMRDRLEKLEGESLPAGAPALAVTGAAGGQALPFQFLQAVAHLDDQPLGGLLAHAGRLIIEMRDRLEKTGRGEPARRQGKYVGICGQGPSDHPDLAHWLMQQEISSISLNPDTVMETWLQLAESS